MASLSLPRVLQLKKNSLDAEREQFEKFQTLAIQKAINAIETPVKEKHVRSTIIGTFQEQSAITYWMVAVRLPFQDNRIVAWKFCHVTHKLLREGHPACLDDSQRHIGMIENLGKLWVHLREGYGKLVHLYCNLLVCKLKFHSRNPRFPGNMQLTSDELDAIAENDVNNYFQLCVELFDYMDDILNLQAAVFDSLGNARANSMTASGQCRLAALIPCAQDAGQLYDCNVRLLFRLHAALPPDTLAGHRERFRQQFRKLSSFYKHASNLQYYRNLLTLPVLPSNPPNFLLQSDFGTYVTPVVSIPEPPPDEVDHVGSLIDTSDTLSQTPSDPMEDFEAHASPSPQPDPIVERDRLIDHLQNELKRMRTEVSQMVQERNTMIGSMREHCTRLESQLQAAKVELEEEKQKAELLAVQTPEIKQKLTETEEKAKVQDEKFQKLKGAYTQLREEHIALIRQKAEVDKLSANLRATAAQHESAKLALQQQLNDRIKDVELLQQSASSSEEIEAYKNEILSLRTDLEQARQKELELETAKASIEALEIEHKTATKEQEEKLAIVSNELKESTETLQRMIADREEREAELARTKRDLEEVMSKSDESYKTLVAEKEAALNAVEELKQQFAQEKEELNRLTINQIDELQSTINNLQLKVDRLEVTNAQTSAALNTQFKEKTDELENIIREKDSKLHQMYKTVGTLQRSLDDKVKDDVNRDECITNLQSCVESYESINASLSKENKMLSDKLNEETNAKIQLMEALNDKSNEISQLKSKIASMDNEMTSAMAKLTHEFKKKEIEIQELKIKNHEIKNNATIEITMLTDKLAHKMEAKNEIIEKLKLSISEKDAEIIATNARISELSQDNAKLTKEVAETQIAIDMINNEFKSLKSKHEKTVHRNEQSETSKNAELRDLRSKVTELYAQNKELEQEKQRISTEFILEKKSLENRLEHVESKKLNAECELQDLLQHNTVLEADLAAVKKQLEDAQKALEKQTAKLVSCAGEAAVAVTDEAIAAFEQANAHDAIRNTAELAAKALEQLARHSDVSGNEESVARSAIIAAHNTAQLSAYVADVSNVSTNMELSDKLNNECRSMLTATKECLESIKSGSVVSSSCTSAQGLVRSMMASAAIVDRQNTGARSVDDELADMDRAIEEAASQIESLLAATRAGDSGVKLEVNGKILDACTTLMAAVKILVQDARKLQNELGDPKTRQKMYRKNPQWSEGLISAAKAVVFAAKLLVTSADEAVGASGQVEGVSAAAHEVAGSTAQLVAASRARAPPDAPSLARLTRASREVAAATGALVAAVKAASALVLEQEALDTSNLSLTATRRLEMESKVRALKLETALDAERARLAALRKRHYQLAQMEENGNMENGKD